MFNNQRHENLYNSSLVDTLWDLGKKVKILKLLRENRIVFSFIAREKNILFTETQGKNCENSMREVWFTDQNSKPREIEEKINTTFVIN